MTSDLSYRPGRRVNTAGEIRARSILFWVIYLIAYFILLRTIHGAVHLPFLVAGIAFPWVVSIGTKRNLAAFNRALGPGIESLRAGDPARAERDFQSVVRRFRWPRFLARISTYNLAQALFRQGKLDEALSALVDVERRGGWVTIDGSLAATISMIHALAGRIDIAEAWLVEARQRYTLVVTQNPFSTLQAEVLVDLRRGRFSEVHQRLDANWSQIEYALKGESLRPLRLLRVFAGSRSADYREAPNVTSLAALEPTRAHEFDYLATQWPELTQFLAEHGPKAT